MGKIITDNLAFVRTVELMGTRDNAKTIDLSDVLPEEVEEKVRFFLVLSGHGEVSMMIWHRHTFLMNQHLDMQLTRFSNHVQSISISKLYNILYY